MGPEKKEKRMQQWKVPETVKIRELLSLMEARRTVRGYKPDPVPDGAIEQILEAGRLAPCGANQQPWQFIVVKEPGMRKKLVEAIAHGLDVDRTQEEFRPVGYRHLNPRKPYCSQAPVFIVVCGDVRTQEAYPLAYHRDWIFIESLAAATMSIHLAATALGLGTMWQSVTPYMETEIKHLLDIPEPYVIPNVAPIGYPKTVVGEKDAKDLEEIVHWERYDQARFKENQEFHEHSRIHFEHL